MNKPAWFAAIVIVLFVGAARSGAQETLPSNSVPDTSRLLAEWLEGQAQQILRAKNVNDGMWRQSLALLQAAAKLNPQEPRYPHLLAEAALRLGDTDVAIDALKAYRKLIPDDQTAQLQMIDLYATQMESADAKLEYYRQILEKPTVPPEVQSAVAVRSVPLMMERSKAKAKARLDQALRLNPVNPTALRMRYEMLEGDASASEQIVAMLAMLRANPAQPEVMMALAQQAASIGLLDQALDWYSRAIQLYLQVKRRPQVDDVVDYAADLLIAGRTQSADAMIAAVLEFSKDDAGAHFLKLLSQQISGDKATFAEALGQARTSLLKPWNSLHDAVPKGAAPAAASRPTTGPATRNVEIRDFVEKIKEQRPDLQAALISAVSDLAWLEVYFAQKPADAGQWIDALETAVPQDNVTLNRLRGWRALISGDNKSALGYLSPIAGRDPLAQLGMIRLAGGDEQAQKEADEKARALQGQNPASLMGAIIWHDLRERRVNPTPNPLAKTVVTELDGFPKSWIAVLDQPRNFYLVRAEPFTVVHKYGEPMFVLVTIQNIGNFDLTVGEEGLIRPDLWFDAQFRGISDDVFLGVAYDRITRVMVLHPRQSTSQVIRIDQGALYRALFQNPGQMYQVVASVTTNPITGGPFGIEPGPGGVRINLNKAMTRGAYPMALPESRDKAYDVISRGSPVDKMRYLALLGTYVRGMSGKGADERLHPMIAEFTGILSKSRGDDTPGVAAWASYLLAVVSPPERQKQIVQLMVIDAEWQTRLLGLLALAGTDPKTHKQFAAEVAEKESNPIVKAYAVATIQRLNQPTTTQSTTRQSTTSPSTQPGMDAEESIEELQIRPPAGESTAPDSGAADSAPPQTQPAEETPELVFPEQ